MKIPFNGAAPIIQIAATELLQLLNKQILFRARWKTEGNGEKLLQHLLQDSRVMESIRPQALYGYFRAGPEGNGLRVEDQIFWEFPLLKGRGLSDAFLSREQGGGYLALSAVTIGADVVALSQEYYQGHDFSEYFLLYGLAAELTETLAEYINCHVERELGIGRSLRRSFGYPACPNLEYQKPLLHLLQAERIGIELSEGGQLIPEFSTTALIFPNPKQGEFDE